MGAYPFNYGYIPQTWESPFDLDDWTARHICTGTGLAPATSTRGLGATLATSATELTWLTPATSALGRTHRTPPATWQVAVNCQDLAGDGDPIDAIELTDGSTAGSTAGSCALGEIYQVALWQWRQAAQQRRNRACNRACMRARAGTETGPSLRTPPHRACVAAVAVQSGGAMPQRLLHAACCMLQVACCVLAVAGCTLPTYRTCVSELPMIGACHCERSSTVRH